MCSTTIAGEMFPPQIPAYRRIQDKLRVPLYYIHMATNNRINCKCLRVLIINFYRLVQFCTRIWFSTSLSVRVSNSGHPVTYTRHFFFEKAQSQNITLHDSTLHTTSYTSTKSYDSTWEEFVRTRLSPAQENIVPGKTVTVFTYTPTLTSHAIVHYNIQSKHTFISEHFPLYFFMVVVRVRVTVTVQSATIPQ